MSTRSATLVAVLACGAAALSACSPSPDQVEPVPPPEMKGQTAWDDPHGSLVAAGTDFVDSFYEGDSERAYALFTDECKDTLTREQFAALSETTQDYEPVFVETVTGSYMSGSEGTITYTLSVEPDDELVMSWSIVDDQWRTPDCQVAPGVE